VSSYRVREQADGVRVYGVNLKAFRDKSQEIVLSGPAETGKTFAMLWRLHLLCIGFPGSQMLVCRKTYKSAVASVVQTFWKKVVGGEGHGVQRFGGERPEFFGYPNGSRIWIGGLDNPDRILSTEYDQILVNQGEETVVDDYEKLLTRVTGRAGVMPFTTLVVDCNPDTPYHYLKHRETVKWYDARHIDNPVLYDQLTGRISKQGIRTMSVLDSLTGVRYKRLRLGLWVAAEGQVFEEWEPSLHLRDEHTAPASFKKITASKDHGFTEPGVVLVFGHDSDNRMWVLHQVYMSGKTDDWWREELVKLNVKLHGRYGLRFSRIACDPSEPDTIAYLKKAAFDDALVAKYGIDACRLPAIKAPNAVTPGIDRVNQRLKRAGDNEPRLLVLRDSLMEVDQAMKVLQKPTNIESEVVSYIWNSKTRKEEPVKKDDHAMDALRYGVAAEDGVGGEATPPPASEIVDVTEAVYDDRMEDRSFLVSRGRRPRIRKR
jgi:phage terminase large subunit